MNFTLVVFCIHPTSIQQALVLCCARVHRLNAIHVFVFTPIF